jgi:hypothetical protein
MKAKLDVKQWAIASIAVFIILTIFTFTFNKLGVEPWAFTVPEGQAAEPDGMSGRIAVYLSRLLLAALFTYIYAKTIADKPDLGHGLRYGLGMGLILFVPNYFMGLAYWNMSVAAQTIYTTVNVIEIVICGAATALLYKPGKATAP